MRAGHQHAYNMGVLHRDISEGNILITGKPEVGKRGALIDFDNAIFWKTHQAVVDDELLVYVGGISTLFFERLLTDVMSW